jgi:hypothetical protein
MCGSKTTKYVKKMKMIEGRNFRKETKVKE